MYSTEIFTIILIIANLGFSYRGFTNEAFFDSYKFEVDRILINKDYLRLISSGFLHVSWTHLLFNMFSLYVFSESLELYLGSASFLVIYFASLIGGNLLSLLIHRHHADYTAVGASGAIAGVIFASIALFPGMDIGIFFLPISFPAWLYGLIYVLFSIYGIRSNKDNIGHDAHLGGAVIGMLVAITMRPDVIIDNYFAILVILVPSCAFIWIIIRKPELLLINNFYYKAHKDFYSIDRKYNAWRAKQQREIDRLLDKISRNGIESLSKREQEVLRKHSGKA